MQSPRRRYVYAAQQTSLIVRGDGLTQLRKDDDHTKLLAKLIDGKPPKKPPVGFELYERAYTIFRSQLTRPIYETVLYALLDITKAAHILNEDEAMLRIYSLCFFDIEVFERDADRLLYLETVEDEGERDMMARAASMSYESWNFLRTKAGTDKVDPRVMLERVITIFYGFMNSMAELVEAGDFLSAKTGISEQGEKLMKLTGWSANFVIKSIDQICKHELNKTTENFMTDFVLKLKEKTPEELISIDITGLREQMRSAIPVDNPNNPKKAAG